MCLNLAPNLRSEAGNKTTQEEGWRETNYVIGEVLEF